MDQVVTQQVDLRDEGSLVAWPSSVERVVICIGAAKSATSFPSAQFAKDARFGDRVPDAWRA
ncbi:hypothetical protein [Maritimibacter sp. UBA3975]|uniref:hypothetical protein n=1 Tax=Maritimibacter sp. UBA3975 TaxID=1946833 RepID=UPI000C08E376|nr:hypothetical protein [Maritimibacter sp. UBA3975]MAM61707.1 hypothetical protein [Maritimibacter sp.]|tara:strand:- start:5777 stop:5962 length:186 start_codon:yes stop_codon:yes gene_type:complete